MAEKRPLCLYSGSIEELKSTDTLPSAGGGVAWAAYNGTITTTPIAGSTASLVMGDGAYDSESGVTSANNVIIGNGCYVSGVYAFDNVVIGHDAYANGISNGDNSNVVIGGGAHCDEGNCIAIGHDATATGGNSLCVGSTGSTATNIFSIAVGMDTQVAGSSACAFGYNNTASGLSATSIGTANDVAGTQATAIGNSCGINAAASQCISAGYNCDIGVSGDNSVAIGSSITVNGASSTCIGNLSTANSHWTTVIGYDCDGDDTYQLVMGRSITELSVDIAKRVSYSTKIGYGLTGVNKNMIHQYSKGKLEIIGDEAQFVLPEYTVATVPTGASGGMIAVTDEIGGYVPAFYDGTNWRRVTDRAIVS